MSVHSPHTNSTTHGQLSVGSDTGLMKLAHAVATEEETASQLHSHPHPTPDLVTSAYSSHSFTLPSSTSESRTGDCVRVFGVASRVEFTREWLDTITAQVEVEALKVDPIFMQSVGSFQGWGGVRKLIPSKREEIRRRVLGETLLAPPPSSTPVSSENFHHRLLMSLSLDYEVTPGCPLLLYILDVACRWENHSPWIHKLTNSNQIEHQIRAGIRSGILENLSQNGYTEGLTPFDPNPICAPELGYLEVKSAARNETNLLTFILGLKKCPVHLYDEDAPMQKRAETIEVAYATWMEKLITVILEQPNVSKEIKYELVNHFRSFTQPKQSILQSVITYSDVYLPIVRVLLKHGADVNFDRPDMDVLPPLLQAIEVDNIAVLIEMILSQPNLMEIDLTSDKHRPSLKSSFASGLFGIVPTSIFAAVRDQQRIISDNLASTHYSTPKKLGRQIIERVHQWQEEQRTRLAADSNYQPNDAPLRDWLRQRLSSLPDQLFSFQIQRELHQLDYGSQHLQQELKLFKPYIDRWIKQLANGHINLMEVSGGQKPLDCRETTLLEDSFRILFEIPMRPYIPQVLGLLHESKLSLVGGLALFSRTNSSGPSVLTALAEQFEVVATREGRTPDERNQEFVILGQLVEICIRRLSHILDAKHSYKEMQSEYLQEMKLLYDYDLDDHTHDQDLLNKFLHVLARVEHEIPMTLCYFIRLMSWFSPLEVFKEIWCRMLPSLSIFRQRESTYLSESLTTLILSSCHRYSQDTHYRYLTNTAKATTALTRTLSFLNDPMFQTTDLFIRLESMTTKPDHKSAEGLNLVFFAMKKVNQLKERSERIKVEVTTNGNKNILDYVIELESKWRTVHWPAIRTNLEEHLIVDLVDVVMNYLQPFGSISRSELSAGLLSPPAQFVLQPTSKSTFTSSTAPIGTSASATATTAIAQTNFSLTAFTWPPSTATTTSTATTAAVVSSASSNPFIFTTTTPSLPISTTSNPFLIPVATSTASTTTSMDFSSGVVNPFLLPFASPATPAATVANAFDSAAVSGPTSFGTATFSLGPNNTSFTTPVNESNMNPHPLHLSINSSAPSPSTLNSNSLSGSPSASAPPPITPPANRLVGIELNPGPVGSDCPTATGASVSSATSSSISSTTAASSNSQTQVWSNARPQSDIAEEKDVSSISPLAATSVKLKSERLTARCEWTHAWIQTNYVSPDPFRRLSAALFPDIVPGREDNLLMKLQLNCELVPNTGYTLLRAILHHLTLTTNFVSRPIDFLTNYGEIILESVTRDGYDHSLLEPFELEEKIERSSPACDPPPPLDDHPPSDPSPQLHNKIIEERLYPLCKANIFMLILETKRPFQMGEQQLTFEGVAHLEWMEKLLSVILDQPTVTKETKLQALNFSGRFQPDHHNQPILQSVISPYNMFIPIARLLLRHGAKINESSPEMDLLTCMTPLMKAIHINNVELMLEMIVAQPNLLAIDLTSIKYRRSKYGRTYEASILSFVQHTDEGEASSEIKSSARNLSRRIIEKLYDWQEEQRQQLTLNPNHDIDDTNIRAWLHQELSAVPLALFDYRDKDRSRKQIEDDFHRFTGVYLPRWVENLKSATQFTRLIHLSAQFNSASLLSESLDLFLSQQFREQLPQLLAYLEDETVVSCVSSIFLFSPMNDKSSIFIALTDQLQQLSLWGYRAPSERIILTRFILQFLPIGIKRVNQLIRVYHEGTFINNSEYLADLKRHRDIDSNDSSCDHQFKEELLNSLKRIESDLPFMLINLVGQLGLYGTPEMFNHLWFNLLSIEFFRSHESEYYSLLLVSLVRSSQVSSDEQLSLDRFEAFLSNPAFQTTDLFQTFHLSSKSDPSTMTVFDPSIDQHNLLSLARKELLEYDPNHFTPFRKLSPTKHLRHAFFDYVLQMESDWRNIHFPHIRTEIEVYIIPDLAHLVMGYLLPEPTPRLFEANPFSFAISTSTPASFSSSTTTAFVTPTGLLAPPPQYVFNPPPMIPATTVPAFNFTSTPLFDSIPNPFMQR